MDDTSAEPHPPHPLPQHPWQRYVALGDSFTQGIGDTDVVSALVEKAVAKLRSDNVTVALFTATDVGFSSVFRGIRGKVAIYNENLRAIASTYDCIVADQWPLREIGDFISAKRPEPWPFHVLDENGEQPR